MRPFLAAAGIIAAGSMLHLNAAELNIYSHRHYKVDEEINKLFTEKTGVEVKVVNAEADQLIERIKSEGENSPADLLITVDVGRLQRAKKEGLFQPIKSELLDQRVPEALRDADKQWYAYSVRARVIMYSKERVQPGEIKTYEDLADEKWRGRVLARSSSSSYNQSLLASIIAANGEEKAQEWAKGVVANMARAPQGGDRDQIKGVAAGLADVCISNTYYLGIMLNSSVEADREAAKKVAVLFPNQDGRGAQANVGGAGLTKNAKNVDSAIKYLEFLTSPEVQKMIANGSYEFPVNLDITMSPTHAEWGKFKMDTETFPKLGEYQEAAVRTFDLAGWK